MLADLLSQDDVLYRMQPVSGYAELERLRDELAGDNEVRVFILRLFCYGVD